MAIHQQKVNERLAWIRTHNHGNLTIDMVVDDALQESSPLHIYGGFQWNVNLAAREHWRDHARELIRTYKVRFTTTTSQVQAVGYVHNPRSIEQGYIATTEARHDPQLTREILREEAKACLGHVARLRDLAKVFGLEADVQHAMAAIQRLQAILDAEVGTQAA